MKWLLILSLEIQCQTNQRSKQIHCIPQPPWKLPISKSHSYSSAVIQELLSLGHQPYILVSRDNIENFYLIVRTMPISHIAAASSRYFDLPKQMNKTFLITNTILNLHQLWAKEKWYNILKVFKTTTHDSISKSQTKFGTFSILLCWFSGQRKGTNLW